MRRMLIACLVFALTGTAVQAMADCVEGLRKATPREVEYFTRVSAGLAAALPEPPAGWTMAAVPAPSLSSICGETREGALWIDVRTRYTFRMPKEQADRNTAEIRKLTAELEALVKLPKEVAAERQGWMNKYSEATRAARQAEKEGNRELAKQKYAERDGYDREAGAVSARHQESVRPRVEPLKARIAELSTAPREVRVHAVVNDTAQLGPRDLTEILVGTIPASAKRPVFTVASVQVQLEGPAAQREALAAAFDRKKLELLLK